MPLTLALSLPALGAAGEVDLSAVVVALVIGGVVGWLASIVMKTNAQMGIVANVIVGVVGSVVARWLAPTVGIAASGFVGGLILSVAGAVLCIIALRFLGIFR